HSEHVREGKQGRAGCRREGLGYQGLAQTEGTPRDGAQLEREAREVIVGGALGTCAPHAQTRFIAVKQQALRKVPAGARPPTAQLPGLPVMGKTMPVM